MISDIWLFHMVYESMDTWVRLLLSVLRRSTEVQFMSNQDWGPSRHTCLPDMKRDHWNREDVKQ